MESATAAPLYSLEAIYKPPASTVGVYTLDILLLA